MNKLRAVLLFSVWPLLTVGSIDLAAQVPAPPPDNGGTPIFRVTVVERTTNAVSYRHRSGWTKVDLRGTPLAPDATGHADVNSRPGYIEAKTEMHKLLPASQYGPEYLTYVLWAITPEGRSKNLGEVVLDGGNSHLDVTTDLQAFALIVTAEPYFGVTQPSDVVVMENIVRQDTLGKIEQMSVKYDLLKRGTYTMVGTPGKFHAVKTDKSHAAAVTGGGERARRSRRSSTRTNTRRIVMTARTICCGRPKHTRPARQARSR